MTRNDHLPHLVVQNLLAQHGRLRLLWKVLMTPRPVSPRSDHQLSAHLRRDIGLIEKPPANKGWEHYR